MTCTIAHESTTVTMASAVRTASGVPLDWAALTRAKPMLTRLAIAANVRSTLATARDSSARVASAAVASPSRLHTARSVQTTMTALSMLQPIMTAACHGAKAMATTNAPRPDAKATTARVRDGAERAEDATGR